MNHGKFISSFRVEDSYHLKFKSATKWFKNNLLYFSFFLLFFCFCSPTPLSIHPTPTPHNRMYPVVIANGRSLQSDAVIKGYHVPKGVSGLVARLDLNNLITINYYKKTSTSILFSFFPPDSCHLPPLGRIKRSTIFPGTK